MVTRTYVHRYFKHWNPRYIIKPKKVKLFLSVAFYLRLLYCYLSMQKESIYQSVLHHNISRPKPSSHDSSISLFSDFVQKLEISFRNNVRTWKWNGTIENSMHGFHVNTSIAFLQLNSHRCYCMFIFAFLYISLKVLLDCYDFLNHNIWFDIDMKHVKMYIYSHLKYYGSLCSNWYISRISHSSSTDNFIS